MKSPVLDPVYLLQQYELLRREALAISTDGRRGYGVLLFLTRGMTAWITAVSCLSRAPRHTPVDSTSNVPLSVRPQITTVLADMVLVCMQEAQG